MPSSVSCCKSLEVKAICPEVSTSNYEISDEGYGVPEVFSNQTLFSVRINGYETQFPLRKGKRRWAHIAAETY